MAKLSYLNGVTSVILRVKLLDSTSTTGAGKTALDHTAAGLIISTIADNEASATVYTSAGSTVETITTLGTFAAPTATKCRFKKVDDTNHPGLYEIQIADARWAVSNAKAIIVTVQATGVVPVDAEIQLSAVPADVRQLLGTAWLTPAVAGTPDVNAKQIGGQAASLNANNLLKVSLNDILATALTETSGQIAGGFKKFFNVATPTGTVNSLPDNAPGAASGLALVGSAMTLTSGAVQAIWDAATSALTTAGSIGKYILDHIVGTLASGTHNAQSGDAYARLGAPAGASLAADIATRAPSSTALSTAQWSNTLATNLGTLASHDPGSQLASSSEVTSIQNNTRVVRVVPDVIERPDSGTVTYRIELFLYDDIGNMEAPDSAPTIALVNQAGTDRSSRLDSTTMSLVETGRYRAIYTADAADTLEQLVWAFSVVEGGATRKYGNQSVIVDTTAVDFTAADRTKLDNVNTRVLLALPAFAPSDPQGVPTLNDIEDVVGDATSGIPAEVWTNGTRTLTDKTGFALTSSERDSIAAALLDLSNGVEAGKTMRQALRLMAAALAGKRSNSGTTSEQFDAIGNPGTARIVSNADSAGDGTPTLTP